MKLAFFPKSLKWRLALGFLAAGLAAVAYFEIPVVTERYAVDRNSGRSKAVYEIFMFPVRQEIRETTFSEMLVEAGLPEEPPRWKLTTEITYDMFFNKCRGCSMSGGALTVFAEEMTWTIRMMEEYDSIEADTKKRMLEFARERMNADTENLWEGVPRECSLEERRKFVDRFREESEPQL